MSSPAISGAILLGHGSREPGTEAEIKDLCASLAAAAPGFRFAHAFLNQEPKLEAAVATLANAGCKNIRVLPLLVFTGRHIIEDVPAEIARLRALRPALSLELDPYLFRLPGFSDLLARTLTQPSAALPTTESAA
jgi:sirohydrochlorin cobaltochelatase